MPKVLAININRIENGVKNLQQIKIPLSLNLSKYITEDFDGCPYFQLSSICYHVGKYIDSGHWKTIKKVLNHWIICDNNRIDAIDLINYSDNELIQIQEEITRNASFLIRFSQKRIIKYMKKILYIYMRNQKKNLVKHLSKNMLLSII